MQVVKVAKWTGLAAGVVLAALAGFVGTRYASSGSEFEGKLEDLAPAELCSVIRIDDLGKRQKEIREFLDDGFLSRPRFGQLEQASVWRDNLGKTVGPSLADFKDKKIDGGLKRGEAQLRDAGNLALFRDVLGGELLLCTDIEGDASHFVALSRVSRKVRFYWQFAGFAPVFAPGGPASPQMEFDGGVMRVKLPASPSPEGEAAPKPRDLLVTLLDDVLVISDSPRLLNACILAHRGEAQGLGKGTRFKAARDMADDDARARHSLSVYLDLDRLRSRLKPIERNGQMVSPVDAYNGLPQNVVKLNYDVLGPINRIVEKDLDTRPFAAAYYGVDLSDTSAITFDQYLLADEERLRSPQYAHLRQTWAQPGARPTQLQILPDDLVMQVSYRQSLEVINNQVLDDASRMSFIGDFTRVLQTIKAEEVVMGVAPRSYQPDVTEISGVPLPAFVFAFRTPGAAPESAGTLLNGFLDNLFGRKPQNPGDPPRKTTRSVRTETLAGQTVYGLDFTGDEAERQSNSTRLTLQTVSALVGEWLVITNSRRLLEFAVTAKNRPQGSIGRPGALPVADLPHAANATIYAEFERVGAFITEGNLLKTLRDAKFNVSLVEGRDPGALRREIAQSFGLNPQDVKSLSDPRVSAEYDRRKNAWVETCRVEGDKYVNSLISDARGLSFFKDLTVFTAFEERGLHARGILRIR